MADSGNYKPEDRPSDHVRNSAKFIASRSSEVHFDIGAISKLAENLVNVPGVGEDVHLSDWKKHPLRQKTNDLTAADWIFLANSLNYSFWSPDESPCKKYAVNYKGKMFTGYWSLWAAINRAIDEGIPILDPRYFSTISEENFRHIVRTNTDGEMPLIEERVRSLHEIGAVLLEKYNGTFISCLRKANGSSQELLKLVLTDFPSYRDECIYDGQKVSFLKRAQALVADIWSCFEGKDLGEFHDIDQLTIFADYRIPQVLNYFGIITYESEMQKKLDSGVLFINGEKDEMEIRGVSIWVSECLLHELKSHVEKTSRAGIQINSVLIDRYLWEYRQLHNDEMTHIPFHKCRCIYY